MSRFAAIWILVVLAGSTTAVGQELWLRPEKYFYEPGDRVEIQIQSGGDFIGKPSPVDEDGIALLELQNRLGTTDIRASFRRNEEASLSVQIPQQGYHFIRMRTVRSDTLSADAFGEYVTQYGLEEQVVDPDAESGPVQLNLTHHIQLSLRSGKQGGNGWNNPLSLPIEIIPDKNPQVLRRGDRIHFKVLENGVPAFGVRVKIWNRWDNRTTIQNIYTEKDGTISTTISNPGDWMVTVVKLTRGTDPNIYTGDSFTLLFGYR